MFAPWIHHCCIQQGSWRKTPARRSCLSEAWCLYKVTVEVASKGLAALSFGEQVLGKENEMWPPPDELPEFRKPHWSIVWGVLGWSDTDLCWPWRAERWAECHPCLEKGVWRGNAGPAWSISWQPAGEATVCVPPLPLQLSVLPSSIATIVFCDGGQERREEERMLSKYVWNGEKRYVFYPWWCWGGQGRKLESCCNELKYIAKKTSIWTEQHLLFLIFKLASPPPNSAIYIYLIYRTHWQQCIHA